MSVYNPPLVQAAMAVRTINVSPKVAAPMFVGLAATTITCVAKHYGENWDTGTIAGIIVTIMSFIGWIVPHSTGLPVNQTDVTVDAHTETTK